MNNNDIKTVTLTINSELARLKRQDAFDTLTERERG